jgi:hypothetical protein
MKTLNFLLASLFLVFLLSSASAVSVSYGEWAGSSSITDGQSTTFNYDFYHFGTSSMQVSVKLYDSSNNLIYTFVDTSTSSASYYNTVSITESIYQNPGTYSLTFYSTDSDNAPSAMTIYLTVSPATPTPDTTSPVITLIGSNPQTIVQGNAYTELGATASDNRDGDLTSRITRTINVNPNVIGTYAVTYFVLDNAGNSATATRTVNVVDTASIPDTTSPVITLIGSSTLTIELGSTYSDAGATATDNKDGNITSRISTTSNLNTSAIGTYQIVYTVSDLAGNSDSETRTINVVDTPSVEITSPTNKTYYKKELAIKLDIDGTNLESCWYVLNDEPNQSISCSLSKFDLLVKAGQNTLTVYANDSAGNLNSDSVTFRYTKKTSVGGSGITTIISPITDVEPTGDVVIPITHITEEKENYLPLYLFLIATTSLGIIILSIILSRKLKEIKNNKNTTQNKIQEQPFY